MAPRHATHPKPVTKFLLSGYTFSVAKAGPIREFWVGLYAGDGINSRFCAWTPNAVHVPGHQGKLFASDWLRMHKKLELKHSTYSGMTGKHPPTHYPVQNPITIDQLVPDLNMTQVGIAQQRRDSFLVRFIIADTDDRNKTLHSFMVEYPGVVPDNLIGKPFWGVLYKMGDQPASTARLLPATTNL